jgi:hypothetical protein
VGDRVLVEESDMFGRNSSYFYGIVRHITLKTRIITIEKADKSKFILGYGKGISTKIIEESIENVEKYNRYRLINKIKNTKFTELSTKKLMAMQNIIYGE